MGFHFASQRIRFCPSTSLQQNTNNPNRQIQINTYQDRIILAVKTVSLLKPVKASIQPKAESQLQPLFGLAGPGAMDTLAYIYMLGHSVPNATNMVTVWYMVACPARNCFSYCTSNRTKTATISCLCFSYSSCPYASQCKYAHMSIKCEGKHPSSTSTGSSYTTWGPLPSYPTDIAHPESELHCKLIANLTSL